MNELLVYNPFFICGTHVSVLFMRLVAFLNEKNDSNSKCENGVHNTYFSDNKVILKVLILFLDSKSVCSQNIVSDETLSKNKIITSFCLLITQRRA